MREKKMAAFELFTYMCCSPLARKKEEVRKNKWFKIAHGAIIARALSSATCATSNRVQLNVYDRLIQHMCIAL